MLKCSMSESVAGFPPQSERNLYNSSQFFVILGRGGPLFVCLFVCLNLAWLVALHYLLIAWKRNDRSRGTKLQAQSRSSEYQYNILKITYKQQ